MTTSEATILMINTIFSNTFIKYKMSYEFFLPCLSFLADKTFHGGRLLDSRNQMDTFSHTKYGRPVETLKSPDCTSRNHTRSCTSRS